MKLEPIKTVKKFKDDSVVLYRLVFKEHWKADGGNGGFYPGEVYYEFGVKFYPKGKKPSSNPNGAIGEDKEIMSQPCIGWFSNYIMADMYCPLSKIKSISKIKRIRKKEILETTGEKVIEVIY